MTISLLNAFVGEENYPANGLSLTPSAGSNRVGILGIGGEIQNDAGGAVGVASVTWGGRSCTEIAQANCGSVTSYNDFSALWYLEESEIALMSGGAITVTYENFDGSSTFGTGGVGPFGNGKCIAGVYEGVDQANIVADFATATTGATAATANSLLHGEISTAEGEQCVWCGTSGQGTLDDEWHGPSPGGDWNGQSELIGATNDCNVELYIRDQIADAALNDEFDCETANRLCSVVVSLGLAPTDTVLDSQPGALALTGGVAALVITLAATGGALNLTGGTADLTMSESVIADPGALTLTGGAATFDVSLNATPATLTLTGGNAVLVVGQSVTADPGTLTLTGGVATPLASESVIADPGALSLSGGTADLLATESVTADPGTLTLTGGDADLVKTESVIADPGALTLTGGAASLDVDLDAAPGALTLTGGDAGLTVGQALAADPGTLTLTGGEATLLASQSVDAQPGTLTLAGGQAQLGSLAVVANPGALTLTGGAAQLDVALDAAPGALSLAGGAAQLDVALDAAPGALSLAGGAAQLDVTLLAQPGMLTLTGGEAQLGSVDLDAQPGTLTLTGGEAVLVPIGPVLTLPTEVAITDTTATVACTTDSIGTALYCYVSLSATPPSAADLKAGTGAVFSQNKTPLFPGSIGFSVVGLSPGTTYFSYFLQDGPPDSNLLESGAWITTGAAPLVTRRGGRFIVELDEPSREELLDELKELVEIELEPEPHAVDKGGRPQAVRQTSSALLRAFPQPRPRVRVAPRQRSRVTRLLAETGLTMEELLAIMSM